MPKRFLKTNPDKPNLLLNIVCFFSPLAGAILVSPVNQAIVPCTLFIAAMALIEFGMSTARRDKSAALSALVGFVLLFVVAIVLLFILPWED